MTCLEPIIFIGTNANNANNRFEIMAGSPMAHLATLRDDCGLVNYTIPVKHYTIRHCQLQNNRQIAPHRILLNTIQRCSKVSKLSIAEQKSSQNVLENHEWSFSLNEGKGGFGWLLRMGVEAISMPLKSKCWGNCRRKDCACCLLPIFKMVQRRRPY